MAVGIPNLDQITTPLDQISGTFDEHTLDSLDNVTLEDLESVKLDEVGFRDLLKVEWSNPTLEQLDAWGNLDSLDSNTVHMARNILISMAFLSICCIVWLSKTQDIV